MSYGATRVSNVEVMVTLARALGTAMSALRPPLARGMTVLDRASFKRDVCLPLLKVEENRVSSITKIAKKYFPKIENFKPVQSLTEENVTYKCIYLDPDRVNQWSDIKEDDRKILIEHSVDESRFSVRSVQLAYENWRIDQIFRAVLPENEELVSGFSHVGHILHLNLRDHLLPYRSLIGQVLLDKIKICRTVVNKSNIIDNTYRNFAMEVIAGEEDFMVTVKENNCSFQFDFSKVYWNPRLGREHERILNMLKPDDVLFDVFCGVGPFSVPALKKKCKVFANDLNPESFKWLNHNAKKNKVDSDLFESYNLDGKVFIRNHFRDYIAKVFDGSEEIHNGSKIHITMNLPAIAVEFLECFNGLMNNISNYKNIEIIVHVYCFTHGETPEETAKDMVNKHIGADISSNIIEVFNVRNVSPKKEMMRVSFTLTKSVLTANNEMPTFPEDSEPPIKKQCT